MAGFLHRIPLIFAALAAVGFAAHAADPAVDGEFVFWQDKLLGRESGIYEREHSVFVVSRVPVQPGKRMRTAATALLECSALLQNWAFEQTRRERGAEPRRPKGIAWMVKFNDQTSPVWRIPPWRIDVPGRQFPSREAGGFLYQAQVYERETLLSAIPASYRRHPSDEAVMSTFAELASAAFRRDAAGFAARCGFSDYRILAARVVPDPPDPRHWKEEAVRLRQEGRPHDALSLLFDALAAVPDDADAIAEIALCRDALGKESRARGAALVAFAAALDETVREKVKPLLTKEFR